MKHHSSHATYQPALAALILRCGLAAVFAYAAIGALHNPANWIGFVPAFSTKLVPARTALDLISVAQLVLAAVLISGRCLKYAAFISAAMLLGITVFNLDTFLITFRDIGLAIAAVALVFLDKN